jgi:hypothetical protein
MQRNRAIDLWVRIKKINFNYQQLNFGPHLILDIITFLVLDRFATDSVLFGRILRKKNKIYSFKIINWFCDEQI